MITPYATPGTEGGAALYVGDAFRDVLPHLPENSVDAVVTDPPYELTANKRGGTGMASVNLGNPYGRARVGAGVGSGGFMGLGWDATGVAFDPETWRQVLRVMKPGAFLLAFGGTRTYHRMTCAVEDAGFEIRDQLQWIYGSGFPKSLDVSKAVDRHLGVQRERVAPRSVIGHQRSIGNHRPYMDDPDHKTDSDTPASPEGVLWRGWGTALKPANEPICLARKPLSGTVAANVLQHGTGALNIDACRLGGSAKKWETPRGGIWTTDTEATAALADNPLGRWPANVLLDEAAAASLDEQSGTLTSGNGAVKRASAAGTSGNALGVESRPEGTPMVCYGDSGGASRFFYTAKPSKAERSAGGAVHNTHATVKPLDLMGYLIRLVTPPGGLVLDPFMGSGTTGIAARRGGWRFIGIDLLEEHVRIAADRIWRDDSVAVVGLDL